MQEQIDPILQHLAGVALQGLVDLFDAVQTLVIDTHQVARGDEHVFSPSERVSVAREMHQSYRNLFLAMGLDHASFRDMLEHLSSTAGPRVLTMRPGLAQ